METISKGTGGFLQPEKVLAQFSVSPGMKVADFGCGHGYFTIPLSKTVGKDGRVYAIDILAETLEEVRSRAQMENLLNIETVRGNLESSGGSRLADGSADLVLLHNVLFQSQKKSDIIKEVSRVLKKSGVFGLIEWQPASPNGQLESFIMGPRGGWRISVDEAKKLAESQGFAFQKEIDAGQYHYGLVFIKP